MVTLVETYPRREFLTFALSGGGLLVTSLVASKAAAQSAIDLTGWWEGRWCSETTGHNGPIKAQVCRANACQYEFRFRGRFAKIIPFRYVEQLNIVSEDEVVRMAGSRKLGPLLGSFQYSAVATACKFDCTYCAKKDHGKFEMTKCS